MSTSAQRNPPIWFSWNLKPGLVSVPKAPTIKNTTQLNRASGLGRAWDSGWQVGPVWEVRSCPGVPMAGLPQSAPPKKSLGRGEASYIFGELQNNTEVAADSRV